MNKHVSKYAIIITFILIFGVVLLISCKDTKTDSADQKTGSIVVHLVWEDDNQVSKNMSIDPPNYATLPSTVTTVRAEISASDMTTLQKNFTASTGSGSISSIPAGSNRTLTLKGLNSSGTTCYEGSKSGLTVTDGQTTDAGTITMSQVGCTTGGSIPTNGLVAYYPFNGNANDESGNGNNGTVNGATLTTDRSGNANSAYSFDGSDYINFGDDDDFEFGSGDSFTFTAWFKINGSISQNLVFILSDYDSNPPIGGYQFVVRNSGELYFLVRDSDGHETNESNNNYFNNTWYFVVGIRDGTTVKLYVNGLLKDTNTCDGGSTGNNKPFVIGRFSQESKYFFEGLLDDIRVYNRALSSSEVSELYNE